MQQVVFRTTDPTMEITVNDCGTSSIAYTAGWTEDGRGVVVKEYPPYLELFDFDGNSLGTKADTVSCIGMPGQRTLGAPQIQPRALVLTIAFDGRNGGRDTDERMYELRRIVARCFPPGKKGTMEYTNSNGTFYIDCYANEYPNMERKAGTRIVTSLYFTADFPYWRRDVKVGPYIFEANEERWVEPVNIICRGDIASPVIGEIKCLTTMEGVHPNGATGPDGAYWGLYRTDDSGRNLFGKEGMKFVKPLEAGDTLVFNTGLNNEVYFRLSVNNETEYPANHYYNAADSTLHKIKAGLDRWCVGIYTLYGKVEATLHYQELYLSV